MLNIKAAYFKNLREKLTHIKEVFLNRANRPKLIILTLAVVAVVAVLIDLTTSSSLSANLADDVLRPTIGNTKTVAIEGFFFNLEDKINQQVYKNKAPLVTFTAESGLNFQLFKPSEHDTMDLSPLKLDSNNTLPGEGQWTPIGIRMFPKDVVLAKTFLQPDPQRPYAIVYIVQMDMAKLNLSAVAGTKEPGGSLGHPGPGKIPDAIRYSNTLVAAFNGGFQAKDGHYGMVVGNQTYLPLQPGLATLVIDKNHNLSIVNYAGQNLGNDNILVRQNGGMLIDNSRVIPSNDNNQYSIWGRTVTNSMYTWRSGIGLTRQGNLLYAVGPSLIPQTLGQALLDAGAVNAMQLDINPYWVRFMVFDPLGIGRYSHYSLLKNMYDGGDQVLSGDTKDFFYLFKK